MVSRYVLIGIIVGVFVAGFAIGSMISYNRSSMMMQNAPVPGPMGWIDPTLPHTWMSSMISNPDAMKNWVNLMLQDPQFMNTLMTQMMANSNFRQQYMGPWMMAQNSGVMHNMMISLPPAQNATFYQHMIIKTDKVSIVAGAWQINTTESYHPTIIQVNTGTTVTWTNDDTVIHTVTDIGGKFDSDIIQPSAGWSYTFYNEGKYNYYCTIHPWMKGLVIVS
ncbi:MAG: hypothetical protein KGI28_01780 [Thaumarchaeota archaeon]|nr:hypothetical protein [Nitrososphaerota archaeon]